MDQWRWGGLVVRDAAIDDLDTIVKLENDSFPEDRVSRRSFAYHLRAPERPVIAVTIDEALAGYVLIALRRGGRLSANLHDRSPSPFRTPRSRLDAARGGGEIRAHDTTGKPSRSRFATTTPPPSRFTKSAATGFSASMRIIMPMARQRSAIGKSSTAALKAARGLCDGRRRPRRRYGSPEARLRAPRENP